jgi:hypothetical protein
MKSAFHISGVCVRPSGFARETSEIIAHILSFCDSVRPGAPIFTTPSTGAASISLFARSR